jgi:uncharacterized protein (DUF433 family)
LSHDDVSIAIGDGNIRQAGAKLSMMSAVQPNAIVHSDPEILGGTPVFVGTRVPLRNLIDYLEGGDSLDEFLDDFRPSRAEQAIAALEAAHEALSTSVRTPR